MRMVFFRIFVATTRYNGFTAPNKRIGVNKPNINSNNVVQYFVCNINIFVYI